MIPINVPESASYDELVLRTITNITIRQLCYYSENLEDLQQAYDLVKRKGHIKPSLIDFKNISNLENKYKASINTLGNIYVDYYKLIADKETRSFGMTFKFLHKGFLNDLDKLFMQNGITIVK